VRIWPRRRHRPRTEPDHIRLEAVLNIGTTTVRALVISVERNQFTVWGQSRAGHGSGFGLEGRVVDRERLTACCEAVLSEAEEMARETAGRPMIADHIRLGVSGAFLWSYVPIVQRRRVHPDQAVSTTEMDRILHGLTRSAVRYTKTLSRRTHLRMKLVSLSPLTVYVDGRWVTDPRGFHGGELRVRAFGAYAPRYYLETLHAVADQLDMDVADVVAIPDALVVALSLPEGIILKIGGTTTQAVGIEHKCPAWFDRFDLGGVAFTQVVEERMGLLPERAEDAKIHFALGGGDESTRNTWHDLLTPTCLRWQDSLQQVLGDASTEQTLPATLFFCGGGSILPDLVADLSQRLQRNGLPFAQPPETRPLTVQTIRGWEDNTTSRWDLGDVAAISVAAHGVALSGQDPLTRRLRQLGKEMGSQ